MKIPSCSKRYVIAVISYLYILLFVYASVSKLLDFTNFRVQVGQSPLVGALAEYIIWLVPLTELVIAALLMFPRSQLMGFYLALGLMAMFTSYIYLIINFSSVVPCSCGGILEKMGWTEHLIFNIVFVLMAALAIILLYKKEKPQSNNARRIIGKLLAVTLASAGAMVGLFIISENIIHYNNSFIRRFTHFPATKVHELDLKFNSFYIAGIAQGKVYIGNRTANLNVGEIDSSLQSIRHYRIGIDRKDLPFRALTINVQPPYFYATDGAVPCIFRGRTSDWKAQLVKMNDEYFTLAVPVDSSALVLRTQRRGNAESVIGLTSIKNQNKTLLNENFLEKQKDGLFDTDGHLLYSPAYKKIVYLYAYRNEFIVSEPNLDIVKRLHTIDTISKANVDIVNIEKHGVKKLGHIPLTVNQGCAVYDNLLFVHSRIPGRYEGSRMWREASIIDIYDLSDNSYRLSFYVYNEDGKKLRDFVVEKSALFGLVGNRIVKYQLDSTITKYYRHKR
ncbi:MauE/DoxX family redox-associated membrane protein [Flavobacterium sp. RHBU_24]|uniref:MauE/DoxX family redox-associated membrane protein n=1 Tax=Flavobacterium sp. RHBU_24 TaxID=3391185 RepID=UPI003984AF49